MKKRLEQLLLVNPIQATACRVGFLLGAAKTLMDDLCKKKKKMYLTGSDIRKFRVFRSMKIL